MLVNARKHEEKLKQLFLDVDFDPHYIYSDLSVYREPFKFPDNSWDSHIFASVYGESVLGMIRYNINRLTNNVTSLYVIRFPYEKKDGGEKQGCNDYVFGKDVFTALKDIFETYRFSKINFTVVIGNPIEKTYDRLIKRYNGRILFVSKQDVKLIDGRLYDLKGYEITAEEYFSGKKGRANV